MARVCTYSAAICAALALGNDLPRAVEVGKQFVTAADFQQLQSRETFCAGKFLRPSQPEKLARVCRGQN